MPGASVTSANSIYQNKLIGVYVQGGVTRAFVTTVPGIYDPITNTTNLTTNTPGTAAITAAGDDVANSGSILATGAGSQGIYSGTYAVVTNTGSITVSGAGQHRGADDQQLTARCSTPARSPPRRAPLRSIPTAPRRHARRQHRYHQRPASSSRRAPTPGSRTAAGWASPLPAPVPRTRSAALYAQTATGTLSLRVSPTVADSLQIAGRAVLRGMVNIAAQPGTYTRNTTYTILNATGGIVGAFAARQATSRS